VNADLRLQKGLQLLRRTRTMKSMGQFLIHIEKGELTLSWHLVIQFLCFHILLQLCTPVGGNIMFYPGSRLQRNWPRFSYSVDQLNSWLNSTAEELHNM
jgi:membrane-bound metal-dependent hydrolase YbcI (DUF457 family)